MRTILRYPFEIADKITVTMPAGAIILDVAYQIERNQCSIWALVDTDSPDQEYKFCIFGTGNPIQDSQAEFSHYIHLKTFQAGAFVWHMFKEFCVG